MEANVSELQSRQQVNDQQINSNQQQSQQQQQQQQQTQNQQPPYTIPGILHYLQYEWHRFEVERQEWEVEKAELSARIALLQGEKKSHENLKYDLIRRIKMLEYCLRMERAKYHKLKHGTDPPPLETNTSAVNSPASGGGGQNQATNASSSNNETESVHKVQPEDGLISGTNNSSTVTYGRELLKHYLQEIGYTDTIIDLRSNRVRSLLGIVDNNNQAAQQQQQQLSSPSITSQPDDPKTNSNIAGQIPNVNNNTNAEISSRDININLVNNSSSSGSSSSSNVDKLKDNNPTNIVAATNRNFIERKSPFKNAANDSSSKQPGDVSDAEASVLANFGFLYDHEGMKDSVQLDEEEEEAISDDVVDAADRAASTSTSEYSYFDKDSSKTTAMIRQEFDLLNNGKSLSGDSDTTECHTTDTAKRVRGGDLVGDLAKSSTNVPGNAKSWCSNPQKSNVVDIGELATLTTLESESGVDDNRKKQWINKYRLQSHYDCVRALCFSETDSLLVTASEDETIKLWHLSRVSAGGKSRQTNLPPSINAISLLEGSTLDIEPLHTYRGHTSRILTVKICKNYIFSGAQNGELVMWKIISDPNLADQYEKFDGTLLACRFVGHSDAVWSIETIEQPDSQIILCSASADLTIKIWNTTGGNKEPIKEISLDSSPTCLARMPPYNVCQVVADMAVSCCDGKIRLYNIANYLDSSESNTQPTAVLECDEPFRINSIVIHPTSPYLASADSNRHIKFWDLTTNQCGLTMVAHLDEVTSLACDSTGKYLLSASHDCSARLWLFEEMACIQEITSHRKKFDEGIFAVAFHPSLSHFATAGADGLAKVFV